ncbi:hypothetical protein INP77_05435 [Methylophilus sp. 13]|uniref:hypothetical protein n=1 Tax=Methylophilus sp. 13 TaxID=2781018 RepID=UPI0018900623|nr:hypothetical protein [Methylophilus sp. 13]MBF5038932.1 hypothetical protein [Methylophilus sp. 13]
MVIALSKLIEMINERKNMVLLVAESSLPENQFRAFRKFLLIQFGDKGLEGELQKIYTESHFDERNGRE